MGKTVPFPPTTYGLPPTSFVNRQSSIDNRQSLPFEHILFLLKLPSIAGGEGLSRGAIQQVSRHPREFQEFARTAVAALRHFRQVQKPLFVLQEIARGLQYRCWVLGAGGWGFPQTLVPSP